MRDFFAIIAIILAVIGLGVFQVPDENALVAAGIKAAADGAVYQEKHPVRIAVKGREITASGRVETEEEARSIEARLAALDGVETVVGEWVILPNIDPFEITLRKELGALSATGYVPDEESKAAIAAALGLEETGLQVAAGVPDRDWAGLALRLAADLPAMMLAEFQLVGRDLRLTGVTFLPKEKKALEARFAQLPEGYSLRAQLRSEDDGLPYFLTYSRDAIMGAGGAAKLPPGDVPKALLDLQNIELRHAPFALDYPRFAQALDLGVDLFQDLPHGVLSVTPGVISVYGGPLSAEKIATLRTRAAEHVPDGYATQLSLIPEGDGQALELQADWDGKSLLLTGHVPLNFWRAAEEEEFEHTDFVAGQAGFTDNVSIDLSFAPHPDLGDWSAPFWAALPALGALQEGRLRFDDAGTSLTGIAADPVARQRAARVLGAGAELNVLLQDDGAPARFVLTFDAGAGAVLDGKLPAGLTPLAMAEALGLDDLRGDPPVSPDGSGDQVVVLLQALRGWLPDIDGFVLRYQEAAVSLTVFALPGWDLDKLAPAIAADLPKVALDVVAARTPLEGERRHHATLGEAQIFAGGYWLPSQSFTPTVQSCEERAAQAPEIVFEQGQFTPTLRSYWAVAHLAAIARSCTRFGGLVAEISAHVSSSDVPVLNQQLSRRRAEAVREALIKHGVSEAQMTTVAASETTGPDRIIVTFR